MHMMSSAALSDISCIDRAVPGSAGSSEWNISQRKWLLCGLELPYTIASSFRGGPSVSRPALISRQEQGPSLGGGEEHRPHPNPSVPSFDALDPPAEWYGQSRTAWTLVFPYWISNLSDILFLKPFIPTLSPCPVMHIHTKQGITLTSCFILSLSPYLICCNVHIQGGRCEVNSCGTLKSTIWKFRQSKKLKFQYTFNNLYCLTTYLTTNYITETMLFQTNHMVIIWLLKASFVYTVADAVPNRVRLALLIVQKKTAQWWYRGDTINLQTRANKACKYHKQKFVI